MKGLLYKDISIMTRSFKGNILLLGALYGGLILVPLRRHQHSDRADRDGLCIACCIFHSDHLHDFV